MIYCWSMNKYQQKHIVTLSDPQRRRLQIITRKGRESVRVVNRAKILLQSSVGWNDNRIAAWLGVHAATVERVRYRFATGGIDRALTDAPRSGQPRKITDADEAYLIAIACSDPPAGHTHWTCELLRERLHRDRKKDVTTVTIWHRLNQRGLKPWREKNVVHSTGG